MSKAFKEQTWRQWFRIVAAEATEDPAHPSRLRKGSLAALTGTDTRALEAFISCMKLYGYCDHPKTVLAAAGLILSEMQPSTRWIAREFIPYTANWEDRERLWPILTSPSEAEQREAILEEYAAPEAYLR